MSEMVVCPRHEGNYDCTPFCPLCFGEQSYAPNGVRACVVPDCTEAIPIEIWLEESGFCIEHSNAYFNQELDPFTLERIEE